MLRPVLAALAAFLATAPALAETPAEASSAVILMYHRFGEGGIPSTNIRADQFERHLDKLAKGGYRVAPLGEIADAIKAGRPIPPKTVAITVDDAYASALHVAWPMMKARGWPMTIFVATEPVDHGTRGYLTWEQLRQMAKEGVTIGAHSETHAHMAKLSAAAATAEIERSNARFQAELGFVPKLFAYPYGEASSETLAAARKAYDAAFGQHSGVADASDDPYFLPRFALNERYGDDDRFRVLIGALPLPVTDVTPTSPTLKANPPQFGFTVTDPDLPIRHLRCYATPDIKTTTEILGNRVEVRMEKPFPGTRGRLNCTLPGRDGQRWHWFGRLFYIPEGVRQPGVKDD